MTEKIKKECLRRMKILQLLDEGEGSCVEDFRLNGKAWKSEFYGILYWLSEEEDKIVKDFEDKYKEFKIKVYHCYRAIRPFGEIFYMLFCSNQVGENKEFDMDIKDNIIYCYAVNLTDPTCSEFGSCYIKPLNGGIQIY